MMRSVSSEFDAALFCTSKVINCKKTQYYNGDEDEEKPNLALE
jgi:hypothetical protein